MSELRRAAGPEYDGPVCEALACSLSTALLQALLVTEFHSHEGSHVLLALRVTLATFTSRPEACAVWDAFVSLDEEGAAAGAGISAAVSSAAAGPEAKDQLFMVFAERVNCWGMLGRWPGSLLGDYGSAVRQLTSSQPSSPRQQKTLAVLGHPSPHRLPQVLWLGCRARLLRASCGDSSLRVSRSAREAAELDPDIEEVDLEPVPESDNPPVPASIAKAAH